MSTFTISVDTIDWEEIILVLTAFAISYAEEKRGWFRGKQTSTFLAGKLGEDYAFTAITKYLENPHKYDPKKGTLLDYLKYNLVRGLVANDLRSQENKTTDDIFATDEDWEDGDDTVPYSERIMPHVAALFPDEIDYNTIKAHIENDIQGDEDAEKILLGIYTHGLKRAEIIEEFKMTPANFDNGMRRLKTALNRASKFFTETKPSV